jgi:glucose-6-phosphate isomerase
MNISFSYKQSSPIQPVVLQSYLDTLAEEQQRMIAAGSIGYTTVYASINVPFDDELVSTVQGIVQKKKKYNPAMLIVIGIGGSTMGTRALMQACLGTYHTILHSGLSCYFLETVDSDECYAIVSLARSVLQSGKTIIINVVTKSGTTTETIVNFELLLSLIKQYRPDDFYNYIVITSDAGTPLHRLAQKEQYTFLEIPQKVGGRFSVFSSVGLFPCAFMGIDVDQIIKGAQNGLMQALDTDLLTNMAALAAVLSVHQYKMGKNVHDLFFFSRDLVDLGLWYRQIIGESLGKKHDINGNVVETGMTPTVSLGSTDLHSVGQHYLGGPRDIFTTFVSISENNHIVLLPEFPEFESCVKNIQGRTVDTIMDAILQGTMRAYQNDNRPFTHLVLPKKNPYYCAQFMQLCMIEIMYAGYLMGINAFDQPNVESYKQETRKILAHV